MLKRIALAITITILLIVTAHAQDPIPDKVPSTTPDENTADECDAYKLLQDVITHVDVLAEKTEALTAKTEALTEQNALLTEQNDLIYGKLECGNDYEPFWYSKDKDQVRGTCRN